MSRRRSTSGQRARMYLEAHRDHGYHQLPSDTREAKAELMRQLEREDSEVRERALVGSDQHFDRRLSKGERSYQQAWQGSEGLDVGDVTRRRRELSRDQSSPKPRGRRPGAGRRPVSSRARRSITSNAPKPAREAAALAWELAVAGIAISLLYLILTSGERGGNSVLLLSLKGITGAFSRLADPTNNLFEPATATAPRATRAKATGPRASAPQVGPSRAAGSREVQTVFGPRLPSFATVTPTIP